MIDLAAIDAFLAGPPPCHDCGSPRTIATDGTFKGTPYCDECQCYDGTGYGRERVRLYVGHIRSLRAALDAALAERLAALQAFDAAIARTLAAEAERDALALRVERLDAHSKDYRARAEAAEARAERARREAIEECIAAIEQLAYDRGPRSLSLHTRDAKDNQHAEGIGFKLAAAKLRRALPAPRPEEP